MGYLPRYAPWASRLSFLANLRNTLPGLAKLTERLTGFTATRDLPTWSAKPFKDAEVAPTNAPGVVLFADCFNRYFEPENLRATLSVMDAAEVPVHLAAAPPGERPLCCGRTFLSAGLVDEARIEARRDRPPCRCCG